MKIIGKYHLTATEKRTIKEILERKEEFFNDKGEIVGSTKRKVYVMTETETGYEGVVQAKERDDYNRVVWRKQSFVVEI